MSYEKCNAGEIEWANWISYNLSIFLLRTNKMNDRLLTGAGRPRDKISNADTIIDLAIFLVHAYQQELGPYYQAFAADAEFGIEVGNGRQFYFLARSYMAC